MNHVAEHYAFYKGRKIKYIYKQMSLQVKITSEKLRGYMFVLIKR